MITKNIPGLWVRGDSQIPRAKNIENLDDEIPRQAWELLDMHLYRAHNWHLWTGDKSGGYATIQTSLNCSFACNFCCIASPFGDRTMRFWSPQNVIGQISTLVRDYGITNIKIADEMFCLQKKHVREICEGLIAAGIADKLNIWAYARIDTVKDQDLLRLMRRAGFRWLGIGIESGSKHVRDGVEKGRFVDSDIRAAVWRVRDAGIAVAANYIFGLPDDTMESMQQTLDLAIELNTEWANFYCAMAYPGSALHYAADPATLPEHQGGPGWIGYSQHAFESMPLPTETLAYTEILDFRDAAFLAYFDHVKYRQLIHDRFGSEALFDVMNMTGRGKPARKHRSN